MPFYPTAPVSVGLTRRKKPKLYVCRTAWRGSGTGTQLAVNKAGSLALLVSALAGLACAVAPWQPKPLQHSSEIAEPSLAVATNARVGGDGARPPPDAVTVPPEATTIILPSRTPREQVRVPFYREREPARLVRDLQRELKRVGCYSHDIDGEWSPATRRAMKDFTDRVNAVLPVERPDPVHLVLVQSQSDLVCRDGCPPGETLVDGRCLPSPVLAAAAKKVAPTPVPQLTLVQSYPTPSSTEPDADDVPVTVSAAEPPPKTRRRSGRPGGFGSLFLGLFSW